MSLLEYNLKTVLKSSLVTPLFLNISLPESNLIRNKTAIGNYICARLFFKTFAETYPNDAQRVFEHFGFGPECINEIKNHYNITEITAKHIADYLLIDEHFPKDEFFNNTLTPIGINRESLKIVYNANGWRWNDDHILTNADDYKSSIFPQIIRHLFPKNKFDCINADSWVIDPVDPPILNDPKKIDEIYVSLFKVKQEKTTSGIIIKDPNTNQVISLPNTPVKTNENSTENLNSPLSLNNSQVIESVITPQLYPGLTESITNETVIYKLLTPSDKSLVMSIAVNNGYNSSDDTLFRIKLLDNATKDFYKSRLNLLPNQDNTEVRLLKIEESLTIIKNELKALKDQTIDSMIAMNLGGNMKELMKSLSLVNAQLNSSGILSKSQIPTSFPIEPSVSLTDAKDKSITPNTSSNVGGNVQDEIAKQWEKLFSSS